MVISYTLGFFSEQVRSVFGPLPSILCQFGSFIRVCSGISILLLSLVITGTKFTFFCIFRSIPTMDDHFLSFTININVNVLSFLATVSKFYIDSRPNVSEVSTFLTYLNKYIPRDKSFLYIPKCIKMDFKIQQWWTFERQQSLFRYRDIQQGHRN